jgi:hypothetical protein
VDPTCTWFKQLDKGWTHLRIRSWFAICTIVSSDVSLCKDFQLTAVVTSFYDLQYFIQIATGLQVLHFCEQTSATRSFSTDLRSLRLQYPIRHMRTLECHTSSCKAVHAHIHIPVCLLAHHLSTKLIWLDRWDDHLLLNSKHAVKKGTYMQDIL